MVYFLRVGGDMVIFIFPMMLLPIIGFTQLFFLAFKDMNTAISSANDNISL